MKRENEISPESEELRDKVLNFLRLNKGLMNVNFIARAINDGSQINNFADMVSGDRRMPEEYIKPLYDYILSFCKSGGDTFDIGKPSSRKKISKNDIVFSFDPSGATQVNSENMSHSNNGRSSETILKGNLVTDIKLIQKITMATGIVNSLYTELKKH